MALPLSPPILPMLAKSVAAVPEQPDSGSPGWVYEPKWDGFRAIVYRDGEDVRIDSRNARPMQRYFPELVDAVREALPERCVIDGEIVVARPGGDGIGSAHLDFDALGQRIHPAESRVRLLASETPASLVVFDVLAVGDDDLTGRPLRERLAALDGMGLEGPQVHATPRTEDADVAREWFDAFEGYRLHKTSTPERPLIGSLLLGLYTDDGQLQFVGVAASFPAARRAALH